MNEAEAGGTRHERSLWLLPVRFLLHQLIKVVLLFLMGLRLVFRPKLVRFGLPALALLLLLGWNTLANFMPGVSASAPQVQTAGVVSSAVSSRIPPSLTVEKYLSAQSEFNARGMWDAISDDMKQSMGASNASLQQLQTELDTAKQQGRRYRSATYVGGTPISDNRNVYFYVLTVETPRGSTDVPYIFVAGPDDKIVSIQ